MALVREKQQPAPFFSIIDELIRRGNMHRARLELRGLKTPQLGRDEIVELATLARRVNLPTLSVTSLHRIIRDPRGEKVTPTAQEIAEYCMALTQLGAQEEAEALLKQHAGMKHPSLRFAMAALFVSQWRYEESIPHLKEFIRSAPPDSYAVLVGRVNLAAAFVFLGEAERAEKTLTSIIPTAKRLGHGLLLGNCHELYGQLELSRRNFDKAERHLETAHSVLLKAEGLDALFLKKWRAFCDLSRLGFNETTSAQLERLRRSAERLRHWETLRACDRFHAKAVASDDIFFKVYFGTPYAHFRRRLLHELNRKVTIPPHYDRILGKRTSENLIELRWGICSIGSNRIEMGLQDHRLLECLASDLYRPQRLASLHSHLFPDDWFNPQSAPVRVRKALSRLRGWMAKAKIPLAIHEQEGDYRLLPAGNGVIRMSENLAPSERGEIALERARAKWGERRLSIREAAAVLKLSVRATLRVVTDGCAKHQLIREGRGPATRYHFQKDCPVK